LVVFASLLTFGAGARRCLGEHFAMHEMKLMLATLIRRFDFEAAEGFEPDLDLDRFGLFIALRSTNGVHVGVARRTVKAYGPKTGSHWIHVAGPDVSQSIIGRRHDDSPRSVSVSSDRGCGMDE
jgi:hypothetical protein